jgi:hypothetical protein
MYFVIIFKGTVVSRYGILEISWLKNIFAVVVS